jgi:peptidoglycan/xylan/chitin deacetylase (PgdA/CDA1 family)
LLGGELKRSGREVNAGNDKMNFSITNYMLHKIALKAILPLALPDRYIAKGESTKDKIVCISFDCDLDADMERIPSLLDLLQEKNIHTSFASVGNLAIKHSTAIKELLKKKHEIVNHSFNHPHDFKILEYNKMKMEIQSFQNQFVNEFNYKPKGFRSPHLMRKYSGDLFRILKQEQLYDSSYVGHGIAMINDTYEVALTPCPEHHKLCFDYWHHFQLPLLKSTSETFFRLWRILLDTEHLVNIYMDPHTVQDTFLDRIITIAADKNFKFLKMEDIVENMKTRLG